MQPYQLTWEQWLESGVSKLRMRRDGLSGLPEQRALDGYGLRPYREGDEQAWLSLLGASDFGDWNRARLDRMLQDENDPLPRESIWFATLDDQPIAAANAYAYKDATGTFSKLGWVCAAPEHRGHGLAYVVSLAVMQYARNAGHCYMFLNTEDFRLAAIKTYLRLGFKPVILDESQEPRWSQIKREIGML